MPQVKIINEGSKGDPMGRPMFIVLLFLGTTLAIGFGPKGKAIQTENVNNYYTESLVIGERIDLEALLTTTLLLSAGLAGLLCISSRNDFND